MCLSPKQLPAELVDRTAKYVILENQGKGDDLGNLRLTCKELHARTMFQLGSHYFGDICIIMELAGQEQLREISGHARFRKHVRVVRIETNPLVVGNQILAQEMTLLHYLESFLRRKTLSQNSQDSVVFHRQW